MKKNRMLPYRIIWFLMARPVRWFFNAKIENKEIIPTSGAVVLAGNHKHAMDPILVDISTKRVVHALAKKDLHDGPFGWFFRLIGTIPVDLKAARNKEALDTAIAFLREGNVINVSPEAKRNYTEEILLPFKVGAVVMAKRTGCKVVPYAITGTYKFRSRDLRIVYGEPIDVASLEVEEANELLYQTVKELLIKTSKTGNGK